MALEPYRPDPKYRDDLDREIDTKIDSFFHRWNWKLVRFITRVAMVIFAVWLIITTLPSAIEFATTSDLGPLIIQLLTTGLTLFFFIGFQFFLMYFFMARTRIYWVLPGETGVSFKDYKGNPEVMEAARRIVTLLKGVKEFKDMGGEATRGVLLIGPPGTGKSYLAQAISTEAGVPFGYLSAPSLTSAWMGMGNIKVMNLYRKARKLAREYGACILFIDEIDAVGGARSSSMVGGGTGMGSEASQHQGDLLSGVRNAMMGGMGMGGGSGILNELLLQMDPPPQESSWWGKMLRAIGLRRKKTEMPAVLTMGATNLAETLDAALLRPGRFDRKIVIDRPDASGRKEIIEYYLGKVKHEPMPYDRMVSDTISYTPVAIKYVINEAVIHAHFDGRQAINYWDFTHAREMHEWGLRQPIRNMSYEDRRRIAYHEAGHAYAMVKLYKPEKERLNKVTIIRHGGALGLAAPKPVEESYTSTKEEELNDIQICLASRAAEEIFLKVQMTGVTGDLQQATMRAALIVGAFGMDNSFISYLPMGVGGLYQAATSGGDVKARVDKILHEEYRKVKAMVDANKEAVIAIAEALILRNELTDIDVNEILARIEAEHPFVNPNKQSETRSFGFIGNQALPAPESPLRRNTNGKPIVTEPVVAPMAQQPATEPPPSAPVPDSERPSE
jgi:ATP-dependent Zn protease